MMRARARERERGRERKRAQSVREEVGVGARSQSERGGGMGSKAAGRQAGRQGGRHAKANKQHWTRTSKARGEEATKGSGGRRGSKGLGTNGVGKKRVTCAPGHPYYSIPCLPACPPFVNRCTT